MEDLIPACDIVCSMFSNCNFDACYINWFSAKVGVFRYLCFIMKEVFEYYSAIVDVDRLPVFQLDLVQKVLNQQELELVIEKGIRSFFSPTGCRKG